MKNLNVFRMALLYYLQGTSPDDIADHFMRIIKCFPPNGREMIFNIITGNMSEVIREDVEVIYKDYYGIKKVAHVVGRPQLDLLNNLVIVELQMESAETRYYKSKAMANDDDPDYSIQGTMDYAYPRDHLITIVKSYTFDLGEWNSGHVLVE